MTGKKPPLEYARPQLNVDRWDRWDFAFLAIFVIVISAGFLLVAGPFLLP